MVVIPVRSSEKRSAHAPLKYVSKEDGKLIMGNFTSW